MVEVSVISRPIFTESHKDFLKSRGMEWIEDGDANDAERLVEFSGRICYLSFGFDRQSTSTNAEYIRKLILNGHDSVLEHAYWSFIISGVTRAFTHQLVRHRIGFSYSQLSQQYHDESDAQFIEPPGLAQDIVLRERWLSTMAQLRGIYKDLLDDVGSESSLSPREALRLRRSLARSVLPNATETAIVVTANARALRHFLDMRGGIVGDFEMRLVSQKILGLLKFEAPALFADFIEATLEDGWPIVRRAKEVC